MKLEIGKRIRNTGRDCAHYGEEGTITEVLFGDGNYGFCLVRWEDEKETVMLARDMAEPYWTGYIYVSISSDKSFPPECVFHCLDGRLYTASGKAGCYRFESFKELFDRLASNGIYVMEVAGLYDEHTGKAKRGEDSDAGREDY